MSLREPAPSRRMSSLPVPKQVVIPKPYQVEEMQVKIRELEGTIEKLKTTLTSEQARLKVELSRSKDTVQKIQQTWNKERAEWQAGCDAIQLAHRINFLKTSIEVDNQKLASFREKENCRLQQIARVQRDFNLVKFQIHESAQEERNAQLADEVERQQEALEHARSAFKEELDLSKERYEFVEKKLARKISEAESILEEKTGLEKSLAVLRAEHASLLSSSTAKGSDIERSNLRYDSLKSTHTELQKKFSELQQTTGDLRRQLDKWNDLGNREEGELTDLRKAKIENEVEIEALKLRLDEVNKKVKDRKEKVKTVFEEQERVLEEAVETSENLEREKEELQRRLAEAERQVQDLKVQAQAERSRAEAAMEIAKQRPSSSGPTSAQRGPTTRVTPSIRDVDDNEVVKSSPRAKVRPASGSQARRTVSKTYAPSDDEVQIQDPPPKAKKGKAKEKIADPISEDEVVTAKPKPKPRPKKAPPKKPSANNEVDSDVQEVPAPAKRKGKRKAADDEQDANGISDEDRGKPAKGKVTTSAKSKSAGKAKAPSRQASSKKGEDIEEKDDEVEPEAGVPKKKKRKINLFAGSQATTFDWDLNQGGGGLDIPTDLSPVKESVPAPSITTRISSVMPWNRR